MTNTAFKFRVNEFENKVHEEGYPDIYFERYETLGGNFGIKCMHKDYDDMCYATGTSGSLEEKYQRLLFMFEHYVRNNPKYM